MSTEYHISVGYNAGGASSAAEAEIWKALKETATLIANDTTALIAESRRGGAPVSIEDELLFDYAVAFKDCNDATIAFVEGDEPEILLSASGGGASRIMKHHVRRAFCRLVMFEMHRRGLEICISVA